MKTALATIKPKLGDKKSNLKKMENYIKKTKADFYVFGELVLTGYLIKDDLINLAEKVDGPSITHLRKIAKKNKCYIVFGMPLEDENIEGLFYNSSVMIHPDGKIDTYNKWFLPTFGLLEEKKYYKEGEKITICKTKFGKIGLIICYDIFFPELCKAYSLQGVSAIICISAGPSINRKYFEAVLPARAVENTVFMIYTNVVGFQDDIDFFGGSQIFDPLSNLLTKAPYSKESLTICEIDLSKIKIARVNRPLLRDTRSEIYKDLYDISRGKGKIDKK